MNYILEIRGFYDLMLIKPMSTGQIALWHALMHINNKCAWIEWFTASNKVLETLTGLSRKQIERNRNRLKQLGLIDFKSNGTKACAYKINIVNKTQAETQEKIQNRTQNRTQDKTILNKPKLNKTKKEKEKKEKEISDIVFKMTCSDEFKKTLMDFIDMRKSIKKPLSERAFELLIKKLKKMAMDESTQIDIINQSILNSWQDIYPMKGGQNDLKSGNKPISTENEKKNNPRYYENL